MFVEGGLPVEISVVRMLNELVRAPLADLDAAVTDVIGRLSGVCGASCRSRWGCSAMNWEITKNALECIIMQIRDDDGNS